MKILWWWSIVKVTRTCGVIYLYKIGRDRMYLWFCLWVIYKGVFTNRPRPTSISISANGQLIKEVTETKFLRFILDNKLKWNAYIDYITRKISKSVSILNMVKYTFPSDILKHFIILLFTHIILTATLQGVCQLINT